MAVTNGTEATHAPESTPETTADYARYNVGQYASYNGSRSRITESVHLAGLGRFVKLEAFPTLLIEYSQVTPDTTNDERKAATIDAFATAQGLWKALPTQERCECCGQTKPRTGPEISTWHTAHMNAQYMAADLVVDGICSADEAAAMVDERGKSIADLAAVRAARRNK